MKHTNLKLRKIILTSTLLTGAVLFIGCGKKTTDDSQTELEPTKPSVTTQAEAPASVARVTLGAVTSLDGLNLADEWTISESGESYVLFSDTDLLKVSLYSTDLTGTLECIEENLLASSTNIGKNEIIAVYYTMPEGMPNVILYVEEHNGAHAKYLVCYNGVEGGVSLIPLVE